MLCSTHIIFWVQEISGKITTTINYYFSKFLNDSFCTDKTLVVRNGTHTRTRAGRKLKHEHTFSPISELCALYKLLKYWFWGWGGEERECFFHKYSLENYRGFESSIFSTGLWCCLCNVLHERSNIWTVKISSL